MQKNADMSETRETRDPLRFRLYFWLMDACLVFAGIGLADHLLDRNFGFTFAPVEAAWAPFVAIPVLFFNFAVPVFLIVARFMRDEYAEGLWRRTAVILAYVVAVVPPCLFITAWVVYFIAPSDEPPSFFAWLYEDSTRGDVLDQSWMAFTLLFVGVFQLLRWLDSR